MSGSCRHKTADILYEVLWNNTGRLTLWSWQHAGDACSRLVSAAAAGSCESGSRLAFNQQYHQQQWLQPQVLQLFEQLRQPWPQSACSITQPTVDSARSRGMSTISQHQHKRVVPQHIAVQAAAAALVQPLASSTPVHNGLAGRRQAASLAGVMHQSVTADTTSASNYSSCDASGQSSPQPAVWGPDQQQMLQTLLASANASHRSRQRGLARTALQSAEQLVLDHLPAVPPAAVTALLSACSSASRPPQQLVTLLQHVSSRAAECRWQDVSTVLEGARLAGIKQAQLQQLLRPILQNMQPPLGAAAAKTLLLAHQQAGLQLSQQQQEVVLQQLANRAGFFMSVRAIHECLQSAKSAGCNLRNRNLEQHVQILLDRATALVLQELQQPAATVESARWLLRVYEVAGRPVPLQVLQRVSSHFAQQMQVGRCSRSNTLHILQAAWYSGCRLQESTLQELVQPLLQDPAVQLQQLINVLKTISTSRQPISEELLAQVVGRILELQQHQQHQTPAQQRQHDGSQVTAAEQSAAVLKAVNCLRLKLHEDQMRQLLQPLLHEALVLGNPRYIASTLIGISRNGSGLRASDHKALLRKAVMALEQTAYAYEEASVSSSRVLKQGGNSSSSSSMLPPSTIIDLAKAVAHHQQQLPPELAQQSLMQLVSAKIYPSADLAAPLTSSFLAQQPCLQEIAGYMSALANMGFSILAADQKLVVCKGSLVPEHMLQVQQLLQQQQKQQQQLTAADVGSLLWSVTSMGYCLPDDLVVSLGRQLMRNVQGPIGYPITQTLWTLAAAAAEADEQQQQAPQAVLMQQLLSLLLQDYRRKSQPQPNIIWQLSVAAWAAALCDATSCKDIVLQLAHELARSPAWESLRQSEHVQLGTAHLWLCGCQWSVSGGLAECFTPEQMQVLLESRQQQVNTVVGKSADFYNRLFGRESLSMSTASARQRQHMPSWLVFNASQSGLAKVGIPGRGQHYKAPMAVSYNQGVLFAAVSRLPYIKSATLEHVTEDGLFTVDIAAEAVDGRKLAIEFDGPRHYAVRVVRAADSHDATTVAAKNSNAEKVVLVRKGLAAGPQHKHQHYLGAVTVEDVVTRATEFRNKALAARGYVVVPVYYKEWPMLGSVQEQKQYADEVIRAALATH